MERVPTGAARDDLQGRVACSPAARAAAVVPWTRNYGPLLARRSKGGTGRTSPYRAGAIGKKFSLFSAHAETRSPEIICTG
jgi:hypothetical protein